MTTDFVPQHLAGTVIISASPRPESVLIGEHFWKHISWESQIQKSDSALQRSVNEILVEERRSELESVPSNIQEEILGWWTGTITGVSNKTFVAEMIDLDGKKSVAEIERRAAGAAQQGDIQTGARFVYSVSRQDDPGGAKTESVLQFLPFYVWSKEDEDYVDKRVKELYEDDSESM